MSERTSKRFLDRKAVRLPQRMPRIRLTTARQSALSKLAAQRRALPPPAGSDAEDIAPGRAGTEKPSHQRSGRLIGPAHQPHVAGILHKPRLQRHGRHGVLGVVDDAIMRRRLTAPSPRVRPSEFVPPRFKKISTPSPTYAENTPTKTTLRPLPVA